MSFVNVCQFRQFRLFLFFAESFQTAQNYQLVLTDNRTLLSRTDQLEQANTRLTSQVKSLSSENEAVKEQRDRATRRAQSLKKENQRLRELFPSAVEMVNGRPGRWTVIHSRRQCPHAPRSLVRAPATGSFRDPFGLGSC